MKKQFFIYLAVGLLLGLAQFVVPHQLGSDPSTVTALLFVMPLVAAQVGALWYFLSSLKTFRRGLRKAYYFLAAGLFFFGLAQFQLPLSLVVAVYLPDFPAELFQLVLLALYAIGTIVFFIAIRKFAKLLDVKSRWISVWVAILVGALSATFAAMLPIPLALIPAEEQGAFHMLFGLLGWAAGFAATAAVAAWRIRQTIGATYKQAATWLAAALTVLAIGYYQVILSQTLGQFIGLQAWYIAYNLYILPYLAASILFLRAGQLFKLVGHQYGTLPENATPLDVCIYAAQLASNPRDIEGIMDPVRRLTAKSATAGASNQLKDTYLKLEEYLVTQEPLRQFDRQELRSRLPQEFQKTLPAAAATAKPAPTAAAAAA